MVESYSEKVMPAEEVVAIYALLSEAGVALWVDGGWCIDALLGQQTRLHVVDSILANSSEVKPS